MGKIYISGKISEAEQEAVLLFQKAEDYLKSKGYEVVNLMKLNHNHDKTWQSYMKVDIKALCDCDGIYMLKNWTQSRGAIIEHTLALYLGIKIKYQ
jgi:hypothetical protein